MIGGHYDIVTFLLSQGANQLLKDDSGSCPMHYACRLGDITITRILMEGPSGRRALVMANNNDQKPIDVSSNNFIRATVEGKNACFSHDNMFHSFLLRTFFSLCSAVMRKHRIFVQPRVSLMERTT